MRILFIGDIVGQPGVEMVCQAVPWLREREQVEFVIANAENSAGGTGMSPSIYKKLRAAGVDAFTMGDHIYKKADIIKLLDRGEPICKPANFPPDAPGREHVVVNTPTGATLAIASVLGRLFMRPVDCPFRAMDRLLESLKGQADCILVDVHAEATGEKAQLGRYLDGRVTAVVGTHTHVPTADEQILPGGTAFLTDVGMTGPYESILGRNIERVLYSSVTFIPSPFDVAEGDPRLAGAIIDADPSTGKATGVRRVTVRPEDLDAGTHTP